MKTAYELFREYEGFDMLDTGETVDLTRFLEAITEHDNEIHELIDDIIKDKDGKYYLMSVIEILTELKFRIKSKAA